MKKGNSFIQSLGSINKTYRMKNFDSRTYSINDYLEWHEKKQLILAPKFQRRAVWSENAKSYLMDTIIRGKPIPKVFIRQKVNVQTRTSIREVVDGQQRLRTIISFLNDGFVISKRHNSQYGGHYFSQLNAVDDIIQNTLLNYEISTDLLVNMSDSEVLDIFSRLNSYSVTLNEQEKINANHFGPFKILADRISHKYNDFWIENKIITTAQILRMNEANLVADLLIGMCEGIRSKKQIRGFYSEYEKDFNYSEDKLEQEFDNVILIIIKIFEESLRQSEFRRIHVFYSLFMSLHHIIKGVKNLVTPRIDIPEKAFAKIRNSLEKVENLFLAEDITLLQKDEIQFLNDTRRATTDTKVRIRRSEFLAKKINAAHQQ